MLVYYWGLLFVLCFVRSVDLEGGNRQVVAAGAYSLEGLAIYEEYVYWITTLHTNERMIERADRFTGMNRQVLLDNFPDDNIWTLRVNHPSKQPTG